MNVVIATAADSKLWTTAAFIMDELELADSDIDEDRIARMLQRATDRCLTFIHWGDIAFQRYTERFRGADDTIAQLSRTPVVKVESVEKRSTDDVIAAVAGAAITDFVLDDAEAGHLYRRATWSRAARGASQLGISLSETFDPMSGADEPNYEVDYWAGYKMPNQTSPADTGGGLPIAPTVLPSDFEESALDIVRERWLARKRSGDVEVKDVENTRLEYHSARDRMEGERAGLTATAFYNLKPHQRMA